MPWVLPDSLRPHAQQPARLLCPWGFSRQEDWSGLPCPAPGDLPNPGNKPRSSALQADSLLSEPPGKPKTTGVGSLSLLQRIVPPQEPNQGLLVDSLYLTIHPISRFKKNFKCSGPGFHKSEGQKAERVSHSVVSDCLQPHGL